MTYRGTVRNGVIVLEKGQRLPEGTDVQVQTLVSADAPGADDDRSAGKMLLRHAGSAQGLPADAARNHDHYLYGTPKR